MPALILLATADGRLAAAWERQLPAGQAVARWGTDEWPASLAAGTPAVLILDGEGDPVAGAAFERVPCVWVGAATGTRGNVKITLSREDSQRRLHELLPLLDEIAEKQATLDLLSDRWKRLEAAARAPRPGEGAEAAEPAGVWDLWEGAWEHQGRREPLVAEFRRGARLLLRAAEVTIFLRAGDGFRADGGTAAVPLSDPLVRRFEGSAAVIDADAWAPGADPGEEVAARSRMALWRARLLAPIVDQGRVQGWIALGARQDGRTYSDADRIRAATLARLLGRGLRAVAPRMLGLEGGRLLREMGLTLAHELGNALVSLASLRQWQSDAPAGPLIEAARGDIARLEALNRDLGQLQDFDACAVAATDVRELLGRVGQTLGIAVETGPEPVRLVVAAGLVEFAVRALAGAAMEQRGPEAPGGWTLQLRSTDRGGAPVALISLRGGRMELAGIRPDPENCGVPNQGRVAVFLAKEILRFHGGEVVAGPGGVGEEMLIALKSVG